MPQPTPVPIPSLFDPSKPSYPDLIPGKFKLTNPFMDEAEQKGNAIPHTDFSMHALPIITLDEFKKLKDAEQTKKLKKVYLSPAKNSFKMNLGSKKDAQQEPMG